ncbi:hypothetical protein OMW55_01755 [Sphingomonas sp. BN140010]|uniref:Uncharacterized protein n=1 Tax=Sphingomonas arvum TaxID=2992113 RepID=A0ABT3JC89_9SPHN|nr:hypothetical protein [Sphingomonas sp. BN140010]MCW3796534.1 hypothetical protein [Sphingomonas sp. BN140010]
MHGDGLVDLDCRRAWWAPAVIAPERNWSGAPGCRRGARFLLDPATCRVSSQQQRPFESRGECLQWIMAHRRQLREGLPGAEVRPVNLARWLLGLE